MSCFEFRLTQASLASVLLLSVSSYATAALADAGATPIPDGHAPAGVMVDHMHKAGEFMIGYRYSYGRSDGDMLHGTRAVDDHEIVHNACLTPGQTPSTPGHNHCSATPDSMRMHMHMLDIMYAPTDWMTLMVMPMWMSHDMGMRMLDGGEDHGGDDDEHGHGHGGGAHSHGTSGYGDTVFGALIKLSEGPGSKLHTGLMFSAPTGSVSEKTDGVFEHYHMQIGSGTWDFLPSLTYNGRSGLLSWGAQVSGVIRMEDENESGYRLGDIFQATAWGSYRLTPWMSASLRIVHTQQGEIEHHYNGPHNHSSPPDLQPNYGGRFLDVGFGVNLVVPDGMLKGHRLGVEWLEPIRDDVNGYQLERDGTLYVNWSKAF